MSNESRRINVKVGDDNEKNIKFKLEQNIKTFDILSLKLTQEDIYKSNNADYGVVIGRVIGNGAVGIPNAKISIFIPIDSYDETNPTISSIYPYKKPQDKNKNNKRYNLLPRTQKNGKPRQPFGSFPSKEEVLCNNEYLTVYEKYYKYSTVTNDSGDYMIFGAPVGSQIIHMSVDITDIGKYSMSPITMVTNLGYSPNLFNEDGTKIKEAEDLTELPNIETQDISINVIPFWGDDSDSDIGITRQDFKIRAELQPTFTIFGSCITMGVSTCIGNPTKGSLHDGRSEDDGFYPMSDSNGLDIRANRLIKPKITLLTYDVKKVPDINVVSDISYNNLNPDGSDKGELIVVDKNSYASIINNGEFALIGVCNRKKVITDINGNSVEVDPSNNIGVFTEFAGSILIEEDQTNYPVPIILDKYGYPQFYYNASPRVVRGRFKIPQGVNKYNISGTDIVYDHNNQNDINWRKSYQLFKSGEYYSIAQFFPTRYVYNGDGIAPDDSGYANTITEGLLNGNDGKGGGMVFKVSGKSDITEPNYDRDNTTFIGLSGTTTTGETNVFQYQMIPNISGSSSNIDGVTYTNMYFGAQWLNMCLAFPQYLVADGYSRDKRRNQTVSDMFTSNYGNTEVFKSNNSEPITGNIVDTSKYVRPTAFQTDFINVSENDIDILNGNILGNNKGVNKIKYNFDNMGNPLLSNYRYRPLNLSGGGQDYNINSMDIIEYSGTTETQNGYIFKGMYNTDCVALLKNNGLY